MIKSRISSVVVFTSVVAAWYAAHRYGAFYGSLPNPLEVSSALLSRWYLESMPGPLARTLSTWFCAVMTGGVLGFALGVIIGLTRPYSDGVYQLANALRTIPVTVLIPIALAVFGLNRFLLPLLILPVGMMMAANVSDAIQSANRSRQLLLTVYGVARHRYLRHVLLFEILDVVFATLRIAVPFALALEVAIDYFLHVNQGIGKLISEMYQAPGHEAQMYAVIISVALVGVLAVRIIDMVSRRALAWKRDM